MTPYRCVSAAPVFQTFFADGTVRGLPWGWYWREAIGAGHFGPQRGPFPDQAGAMFDLARRAPAASGTEGTTK